MAKKTYKIQVVWNNIGNSLAQVDGEIEWDCDEPKSVPHLLCAGKSKVPIDKRHLKEVKDREFHFVYETPGFDASKVG